MQASKVADTYGLFEGHAAQQADARQAYAQSRLKGAPYLGAPPREKRGHPSGKA